MNDFAFQIAVGQKFPRFIFGFEVPHPTILIHYLPLPECEKRVVGRPIYSVTGIFDFVSHNDPLGL
jgi:hypothetical protein